MKHKIQINDLVRDATLEEAADIDDMRAKALADNARELLLKEDKNVIRNSALNKLKLLGLTVEEIMAVVG